MRHLCLVLGFLALATSADAARFTITLDGQVNSVYGTGPSLTSLGLAYGTPLHYEVLVDTGADGFLTYPDGTVEVVPDQWYAPDRYREVFYAELLAEPFVSPNNGLAREYFAGMDEASPVYPGCGVLGRLFVGTDMSHIDSCGSVASWTVGQEARSDQGWWDETSRRWIYVWGGLTVTEVVPLAEPGSGMLVALGIALLGVDRWRPSVR